MVWSPAYEVDVGPHVFPTAKYRLVRERLLEEGTLDEGDFVEPEPASREDLARVHTPSYLEKIERGDFSHSEVLRLEVPFSAELRESMTLCCGGTTLAGRRALEEGVAVHLGGGFHHAFADHGEGFCLLNDVAVAAAALLARDEARRIAVVDLDVHQGNGTAAIFADEDRVFTFSMHQERNYPFPKPPSDLDVGLEDGIGDDAYLSRLREHLPGILGEGEPDLAFYLAGADPYREDQLGGLGLSMDGLRTRDDYVLEICRAAGVAVAILPAGGYAVRESDTVEIHCATVRAAVAAYIPPPGTRP
ncbi:MAG: histone deacetylase [Gemmatimonadetes bacterium]|nr:histone deacetylase [Gemmatimonadota bacterium]NIR78998.1 histone deacetylase [Gemmatimonadota bacterium]NIT89489.1 histone deacetylase [Gemmatimonadota bacterium]NIU31509.1 histone deacetylase [Gemmatimonadota bacterium]NIU36169.1 histone deacetylase [Gemmatimonadota bacterium]